MKELSVFVDESGSSGNKPKYYLLTLVFHDQSEDIAECITRYRNTLRERGLPDIPLHMNPLMRGNDSYKEMGCHERIRLLSCFNSFAVKCPFHYAVLAYQKSHFDDDNALFAKMRKDLILFLFDHIAPFQAYEAIKIYYDDGQGPVTKVLHDAFEYALGAQAIVYRDCAPSDFRLQQIADYICEIELAAIKFEKSEWGGTEKLIFGTWRDFNKGHLKKMRKKKIS